MVVLVTCKNDEELFKMKALECSQNFSHYKSMVIFFRRSRAANSVDPGPISPNFDPMQAFIAVRVTCENE